LLNKGSLERFQLQFILENHKKIKSIIQSDSNYEINIFNLFYAFNIVQYSNNKEIINLQKEFDRIKKENPKKNIIYFVVLGVTNHWSLMVLEKKKSSKIIEVTYLDSLNLNIFNLKNDREIDNFVEKRDELRKKYGKGYSPFQKKMFRQWIVDINQIVNIVYQIIYEDFSLYDLIVSNKINHVLTSYEDHININLREVQLDKGGIEKMKNNISKIAQWLKNEFPPKILVEDVTYMLQNFNFIPNLKNMYYFTQFQKFISLNISIIDLTARSSDKGISSEEKNLLGRFNMFLKDLSTRIS